MADVGKEHLFQSQPIKIFGNNHAVSSIKVNKELINSESQVYINSLVH